MSHLPWFMDVEPAVAHGRTTGIVTLKVGLLADASSAKVSMAENADTPEFVEPGNLGWTLVLQRSPSETK